MNRQDSAADRLRAATDAELRAMVEHLARLTGPNPERREPRAPDLQEGRQWER